MASVSIKYKFSNFVFLNYIDYSWVFILINFEMSLLFSIFQCDIVIKLTTGQFQRNGDL